MNVLPYEVKRAHWKMTWTAIRKFCERADAIRQPILRDMTPARFDFLYVIWRADWQFHEARRARGADPVRRRINLSELRGLLGLAGSTVSRMAHRLDALEYVCIVPHSIDKRAAVVVLTELGEKLLRLAVDCIRQAGVGMVDRIARYISLDGESFAGLASERAYDAAHEESVVGVADENAFDPAYSDGIAGVANDGARDLAGPVAHAQAGTAVGGLPGAATHGALTADEAALAEEVLAQAERALYAPAPSVRMEMTDEDRARADAILDHFERMYDPRQASTDARSVLALTEPDAPCSEERSETPQRSASTDEEPEAADEILERFARLYESSSEAGRSGGMGRGATSVTSAARDAPRPRECVLADSIPRASAPLTRERRRMLDRLAMVVDRWRALARFFGCNAVPIYDTRFVTYLRPHAVTPRTWHMPGHDFRSRVLILNQQLRALERTERGLT